MSAAPPVKTPVSTEKTVSTSNGAVDVAELTAQVLEEHWATVKRSAARLEYERVRATSRPDASSQMALANLARKLSLPDVERVHLSNVIDRESDHPEARKRLGFVRRDGEWTSRRQEAAERVARRTGGRHGRASSERGLRLASPSDVR
ncbi:MAG: hypothetical protein QM811_21845 [Pirellulales bacterium]